MRKTRGMVALVLGAALALSGCGGRPPGVDGNLTNNWPAQPPATVPLPADRACYALPMPYPTYFAQPHATVDCSAVHNLETVHVGTFTGADASGDDVPPAGSSAQRHAYEACDKATREFLGADWRTARMHLFLTLPRFVAWSGGARWYRCDLEAYLDTYHESSLAQPTHSLRGELTGLSEYSLGCASITRTDEDHIDAFAETGCTKLHNAEFAGVWDAPEMPYESTNDKGFFDRMYRGCAVVVGKYMSVSDANAVFDRMGMWAFPFGKDDWALGNRGYRCYVFTGTEQINYSFKGIGPKGLPSG